MEQQFLQLLQENQGRLQRICRYYTRSRHSEADLYQEICFQLWKSFPRFRGDSQPDTWLYRVALNTAISHLRKAPKHSIVSLAPSHYQVQQSRGPDKEMEDAELISQLHGAIRGLNKLDQTLVLLYLEELSYQEIAEITGLSVNNVGVRLNRIKKRLARQLPS